MNCTVDSLCGLFKRNAETKKKLCQFAKHVQNSMDDIYLAATRVFTNNSIQTEVKRLCIARCECLTRAFASTQRSDVFVLCACVRVCVSAV